MPEVLKEQLSFKGEFCYILNLIASDRKEIFTKQMAPNFYKETCKWFDAIYSTIQKSLKEKNKVALIETYHDQNLKEVVWNFESLPISKLKDDEISFEFDTIYYFTM